MTTTDSFSLLGQCLRQGKAAFEAAALQDVTGQRFNRQHESELPFLQLDDSCGSSIGNVNKPVAQESLIRNICDK